VGEVSEGDAAANADLLQLFEEKGPLFGSHATSGCKKEVFAERNSDLVAAHSS
jgi:hypothetical protein